MSDIDRNTYASEPGEVHISEEKWNEVAELLKVGLFRRPKFERCKEDIEDCLLEGDTQPAVVMSTDPLIISAYSDEMDAVILLRFPQSLGVKYGLRVGDRLTTANVYWGFENYAQVSEDEVAKDIFPGEDFSGQWFDFRPVVMLFFSHDTKKMAEHLENVPESHWEYVEDLSRKYFEQHPEKARDGFYYLRSELCLA